MRILALRVLLSWWLIPAVWLVSWPIAFLMFGRHNATAMSVELSEALWFGGEEV